MEETMGFERHNIPSVESSLKAKADEIALREAAAVVTPLRPADPHRETDILRQAREMRAEWRQQRLSRLSGN
jgi:hypothetical protein